MMEDHPLLQANGGGGAANLMDQARHNFPGALLGLQGKIPQQHTSFNIITCSTRL